MVKGHQTGCGLHGHTESCSRSFVTGQSNIVEENIFLLYILNVLTWLNFGLWLCVVVIVLQQQV